jgi:hypothetical protein
MTNPTAKIIDLEHALNIVSSAAEEIGSSDHQAVADAYCPDPRPGVPANPEKGARMAARMAALSEALLDLQEEYAGELSYAADRAAARTGFATIVDAELYETVDGLRNLENDPDPVA